MTRTAVYLTSLGCRLNDAELISWRCAFEGAGHRIVHTPHDAGLLVINTCAVTAEAARKSRKLITHLHRKNPEARLVVTGCFAALEPERAASLAGVDLVVGNADKDTLVEKVQSTLELSVMPEVAAEAETSHLYADCSPDEQDEQAAHTRAFVKVQDGCRNRCTYCVVTIARGDERSRAIDDVVREIDELADRGYREAVLTGVHLGGYGCDLDTDLFTLVEEVLHRTNIERIRLSSLEPWDLPPHFAQLWQSPRLMPHLHMPVQSGSDSVLKRMARRCFTGEYRQLVDDLRAAIPDLNVTTDLIVGFPGESESEWQESLRFVEDMAFGHVHIFGFSPRKGTRAATLAGRVTGPVIKERSRQMHRLAAHSKERFLRRYLGTTRAVLWEGAGAVTADRCQHSGYTDNYLRVETVVEPGTALQNQITRAELVALDGVPVDRISARLVRGHA